MGGESAKMKETAFARDLGDRDFRRSGFKQRPAGPRHAQYRQELLGIDARYLNKAAFESADACPDVAAQLRDLDGSRKVRLEELVGSHHQPQLLAPGSAFPGDVPVGGWQDGGERGGQALLDDEAGRDRIENVAVAPFEGAEYFDRVGYGRRNLSPSCRIQRWEYSSPRFQIHPHRFEGGALELKTHPASPRREAAVKLGVFRQGERHRTAKRYTNHIPGIGFRLNETEHDTIRRHRADDKDWKVIGAIVESAVAKLGVQDLAGKASGLDLDMIERSAAHGLVQQFRVERIERQPANRGRRGDAGRQKLTFAGGDPTIQILDGIHWNPGNHGEFFQHVHVRYPRGGDFMTTTPLLLLELSVALIILAIGMDSTPRDMASLPGPRTAVVIAFYILTSAAISIPYLRWRRTTASHPNRLETWP